MATENDGPSEAARATCIAGGGHFGCCAECGETFARAVADAVAQARRDGMEAAAKIAESKYDSRYHGRFDYAGNAIADAIRAAASEGGES